MLHAHERRLLGEIGLGKRGQAMIHINRSRLFFPGLLPELAHNCAYALVILRKESYSI